MDFEFEELEVPQVPPRGPPASRLRPAARPASRPRYVPVRLRKTCQVNAYRLFQLKRSPSLQARGQLADREATAEELLRDFEAGEAGEEGPRRKEEARLVVRLGSSTVPVSLLRTLYLIVREGSQTQMLPEDLRQEYLSIVRDLQRAGGLAAGLHCHRALLEEIELRVRRNEEERMCNEGPSEQEINLVEEYLTDLRASGQHRHPAAAEGLLDSLTPESIFDQKNTIDLIKKSMFSHYGYFSENAVDSEEDEPSDGAGSASDCAEREKALDPESVEGYLHSRETQGEVEEVAILREILSWRKDLRRIIKMM